MFLVLDIIVKHAYKKTCIFFYLIIKFSVNVQFKKHNNILLHFLIFWSTIYSKHSINMYMYILKHLIYMYIKIFILF